LNATEIPGFLKYLGLVVEKKNRFRVRENPGWKHYPNLKSKIFYWLDDRFPRYGGL